MPGSRASSCCRSLWARACAQPVGSIVLASALTGCVVGDGGNGGDFGGAGLSSVEPMRATDWGNGGPEGDDGEWDASTGASTDDGSDDGIPAEPVDAAESEDGSDDAAEGDDGWDESTGGDPGDATTGAGPVPEEDDDPPPPPPPPPEPQPTTGMYEHCHADQLNCDQDLTCLSTAISGVPDGFCSAPACSNPAVDCEPAPAGVGATPACGTLSDGNSYCRLACTAGTCPQGMVCANSDWNGSTLASCV